MIPYRVNASGNGDAWKKLECCEFGISPGSAYHYGDKLLSMVDWGSKHFKRCTITLSDTLYRHNIVPSAQAETKEAYRKARKLGDEWLAINAPIIKKYDSFIEKIYRWDEWIDHKDYPAMRAQIGDYYDRHAPFRQTVDADATRFVERRAARGLVADWNDAVKGCRAFLLEELACYNLIGRAREQARVYPANDIPCFAFLRGADVPEDLRHMTRNHHVGIKLSKKPSQREAAPTPPFSSRAI